MRWRLAGAAAVAAAALSIGLWWQGNAAPLNAAGDSPAASLAATATPGTTSHPLLAGAASMGDTLGNSQSPGEAVSVDEAALSAEARREHQLAVLREALQTHQDAPGNLRAFFTDLARHCDSPEACRLLLADVLAGYPDPAFAEMVARIQERMPQYEASMQSTVMSMNDPARARYEAVHAQREQLLGVEETALMFGQENAWANYRFDYGDLLAQAPQLSSAQRQQALEALRQQHFTEYGEALHDIEGRRGAYQHALELQLTGVTSEGDKARITRSVREQFFSAEEVAAMTARDAEVNRQAEAVSRYREALAALDAEFGVMRNELPAAEWQSQYQTRLEALRRAHFSTP